MNLKTLHRRIPKFECVPGCTKCCGIVVWSGYEWARVGPKGKHPNIAVKKADEGDQVIAWRIDQSTPENCCFIEDGHCGVYSRRPLLCRLYGIIDDPRMQCPHGGKPERLLSQKETLAITDVYLEKFLKMGPRRNKEREP